MTYPSKALGQNFLRHPAIAQFIASLLQPHPIPLVELGPGKGILTQFLIGKGNPLLAVEIDPHLVAHLKETFADQVHVIHQDFRTYTLPDGPFSFAGNIPYYLTSQVLFSLWERAPQVVQAALMVQKEVADRLCAQPGHAQYRALSVLFQRRFKIRIHKTVRGGAFFPRPKVISAILTLHPHPAPERDWEAYRHLIRQAFRHPRKKLIHNLPPPYQIPATWAHLRPHQLHLDAYDEIFHLNYET
ncbi:MAG: 16S rRNA (adenine(1518)-N(6)/adenine(1519)-N(6))-dimethyltransferase RsmA [Bacteroidia bacterium]